MIHKEAHSSVGNCLGRSLVKQCCILKKRHRRFPCLTGTRRTSPPNGEVHFRNWQYLIYVSARPRIPVLPRVCLAGVRRTYFQKLRPALRVFDRRKAGFTSPSHDMSEAVASSDASRTVELAQISHAITGSGVRPRLCWNEAVSKSTSDRNFPLSVLDFREA